MLKKMLNIINTQTHMHKLNDSSKIENKQLRALLQVNCVSNVDSITS